MDDNSLNIRLEEILLTKTFSMKDTGLSYRMINNWSEKNLLSDFRDYDTAWHKFSYSELIEVLIYKELREFGFPIANITKIKSFFDNRQKVAVSPKSIVSSPLLTAVIKAFFVKDVFFSTDNKADQIEFIEEDSFKLRALNTGVILIGLRSIIKSTPFSGVEIAGSHNEYNLWGYLNIEKAEFSQLASEISKRTFESIPRPKISFLNN